MQNEKYLHTFLTGDWLAASPASPYSVAIIVISLQHNSPNKDVPTLQMGRICRQTEKHNHRGKSTHADE